MRKVIVSEFVSLDGVVENPAWTFQFGSQEQEKYKFDELFACDALLLGRVTYQGFAAAWPKMTDTTGVYGERMNSMPKYVASTTLTEMEWNANLIKGDLAEEVLKLKQQSGQDILVFGSSELVYTLTQLNLVDEYRLMVFPIVLGSGKRIFKDGSEQKTLKLIGTKTFASGVVVLSYEPAAKSDEKS